MRDCQWVPKFFDNLTKSGFDVVRDCTSDSTYGLPVTYNCIAWAAGKIDEWWWPLDEPGYTWPPELPKENLGFESMENFVNAFKLEGYTPCRSGNFEEGFEKVAIFAENKTPTHAARSLQTGVWTSKLGPHEDIQHATLEAIEGKEYGYAVAFLKRRNPKWPRPNQLVRLRSFLLGSLSKLFKRS